MMMDKNTGYEIRYYNKIRYLNFLKHLFLHKAQQQSNSWTLHQEWALILLYCVYSVRAPPPVGGAPRPALSWSSLSSSPGPGWRSAAPPAAAASNRPRSWKILKYGKIEVLCVFFLIFLSCGGIGWAHQNILVLPGIEFLKHCTFFWRGKYIYLILSYLNSLLHTRRLFPWINYL